MAEQIDWVNEVCVCADHCLPTVPVGNSTVRLGAEDTATQWMIEH